MPKLIETLHHQPVLTVGEESEFGGMGGMIYLFAEVGDEVDLAL